MSAATIHSLVKQATARADVRKEGRKPEAPWTAEQKEHFRELFKDNAPSCIVASREMLDYGGHPNLNFNKLVTTVKIPFYKALGTSLKEALDAESSWLRDFEESGSYDTEDKRIEHFKQQWAYEMGFSCGVNRAYIKGFDCTTCPHAEREIDYSPLRDFYGSEESGIADINRLHSHVTVGKDTYVLRINPPSENGEPITFLKLSAFRDWYAHIVMDTGEKDAKGQPILTTLAPLWLRHRKRKRYDDVGFYPHPAKPVPNHFNLFRGFRAERMPRIEDASCALYLDHIRNVICAGDDRLYQYVMAWLAHLIQKPGDEKPGTAIAIRGPQGCGKGTLTKWIQAVIGPIHSMKISTEERLLGRFNSHLMDKLFVNADECVWSGNRKIAGVLKALITESPLDFEQKGVNPINLPSYLRIIFTSNEKWMVPADSDDRRFVVLDCGTSHVKDRPYYKALNEQMDNGGTVELYHTLLEWDYSDIDIRQAPSTKALIAQKLESLPTVDRWWYGVLHRGAVTCHECVVEEGEGTPPPEAGWVGASEFLPTQELYRAYADSLKGSGRRVADDVAFGRRLKELSGVEPVRIMRDGQRRKGYEFPPLAACRERFATFLSAEDQDMDWPTPG